MAVAITGIGIISALGIGLEENYAALLSDNTGIALDEEVDFRKSRFLGRVKLSDEELQRRLGLEGVISRTALLGLAAANEAWGDLSSKDGMRCGLISGTTVGGMDLSEKVFRNYHQSSDWKNIERLAQHDNGFGTDFIADHLNINDFRTTISTACSSAANAILMGAEMIKNGTLDRVLVGGTDALTYFTVNGFDSLMIFDGEWCKPFSEERNGLNLGEGAAYLLLESEESMKNSGNQPMAMFSGGANAADAYHQTASSPDGYGATLAIQQALEAANISPEKIDYVNAHGTGTKNNDLSESIALKNVFKEQIPPFSSTKGFTGHTLAAAGGIEAVFSVLSLINNQLFSNLNFKRPIDETKLSPVTELISKEVNYVLSNSFGFGGNNTALIFSKVRS